MQHALNATKNAELEVHSAMRGNHWIHYKCQRLTEHEIYVAENSKADEHYECEICGEANMNILALEENQDRTQAQQLLDEETINENRQCK